MGALSGFTCVELLNGIRLWGPSGRASSCESNGRLRGLGHAKYLRDLWWWGVGRKVRKGTGQFGAFVFSVVFLLVIASDMAVILAKVSRCVFVVSLVEGGSPFVEVPIRKLSLAKVPVPNGSFWYLCYLSDPSDFHGRWCTWNFKKLCWSSMV